MSVSTQKIAIAGRVVEGETQRNLASAVVKIIAMPEKFQAQLSLKKLQYGSQWEKMLERLDRKITTNDGYFHFTNLPPGEYILEASLPTNSTRYNTGKTTVTVFSSVEESPITFTDIIISPTGIKGKITDIDQPNQAIFNAKLKIKESQNTTFSDKKGNYRFIGLESSPSGQRHITLIISANGYQELSQSLIIQRGEIIADQNFALKHK
ncbi:MAG TPA: carboxypeptidase regulatory-like domain-containing protein [Nostocaceae cyanobacterium]|nr:carboxypeptidase regulatory-like domain-containing protein [Nostocaceae cyanobacterium]